MLLLVFFAAIAWIASKAFPRADGAIAWLMGIALALLAGTRSGGFDRDEYESIITTVRTLATEDWVAALFFAKDPFFLLIIRGVELFSDDTIWVYLLVSGISVATKVQASVAIPKRRTTFVALYAILLSPGLEFAAIRSGMAIGLLMLALSSLSRWRSGWAVAAALSHSSIAVAWIGRLFSTHRWLLLALMAVALPAGPMLAMLAQSDPRYSSYFENPGTAMALVLPLLTLLANIALRSSRQTAQILSPLVSDAAMSASLLCAALALLLALPFVTIAFRIMEIAWVLMLAQWLTLSMARGRGMAVRLLTGVTLVSVMSLANVLRSTWTVLVDLPL